MDFPEELKYSKEHVWVRVEGSTAVIGVTDFAQEELGPVSGVELPDEGDEVEQDDSIGSIEARKTVADIYAPFSGSVVSVNQEALDNPSLLNDDPYDGGWLLVIEMSDPEELKLLMTADDYLEQVEETE